MKHEATCSGCGARAGYDKPWDQFIPDKTKSSGYGSRCKPCDRAKGRAYYAANREAKLAKSKARQASLPPKPLALPVERACEHCNSTFLAKPKGGRQRKYCSDDCRRAVQAARRKERGYVKPKRMRTAPCERCGREFQREQHSTSRRYCSPDCRRPIKLVVRYYRRRCAECSSILVGRQRTRCQPCAALWREHETARRYGHTDMACRECGGTFVGGHRRKYCSASCSARAQRRRSKKRRDRRIASAAQREPVDLPTLALRDGWRCHICKRRVSRKTWSIDHLVPLSDGGDHTYANIALAHHLCNSIRGAHGAAQLRFAG